MINLWFDVFLNTSQKYHFKHHNIYNMDETSFVIGASQYSRVIIDATLRTHYKIESGKQE